MARSRKPLLLFGTPRSGTTLFYALIAGYLEQIEGVKGLGEYFVLGNNTYWDAGGHIAMFANRGNVNWYNNNLEDAPGAARIARQIMWQRDAWLQKHYRKHFIKVLAQVSGGDWLHRAYEWVFVERRNVFENMLSVLISNHLQKWYEPGGLKVEPRSITASETSVRGFAEVYRRYVECKTTRKPRFILIYEDYLENPDPAFYLKKLGLTKPFDCSRLSLPEKQNSHDKLSRFTNPEAVCEWYRASSLQRHYPI